MFPGMSFIIWVLFILTNTIIVSHGHLKVPQALRDLQAKSRGGKSLPSPKVYRCGDIGKDLVVNFVSQNYPDDDSNTGDCAFRFVVTSHDICQIRVDFVDTELMDPVRGECLSQFLIVEGSVWPTGLPPLCGINNEQHFYLHLETFDTNTSIVDFKFITVVRGRPYRFGVWLTQIDCSSFNILRAPEGCTQYYLAESGSIKSFNYEGYRYLNGQSYEICIRPSSKEVCGIRYESSPGDFGMKKSIDGPREMLTKSGVGTSVCGLDYVMIPDGRDTVQAIREGKLLFRRRRPAAPAPKPVAITKKKLEVKQSHDRFCGGYFSPNGGDTGNKPIFVRVRSNLITLRVRTSQLQEYKGKTEALNLTTGFKISYTQIKSCEESEVPEMVVSLPIVSMVDNLNERIGSDFPLKRQPAAAAAIHTSPSNVTVVDDDDKIWEYLYAETDDTEADEADLYDY